MLLTADRIIYQGFAYADVGIEISEDGRIAAIAPLSELGTPDVRLERRVLLPGMVNAHSHGFQRLLRGRTQFSGTHADNFWSWREAMYHVANALDPNSLYTVSRQVFLEMMLHGITAVGEFHYLHFQPDGSPYEDDPNAMALAIVNAARDVGMRVSIIQSVYLHGGFDRSPTPWQRRFCDTSVDAACDRFDALVTKLLEFRDPRIAWGIAAHSLRAVTFEEIMSLKVRLSHMPFHMHISEQQSEVEECIKKYGARPVEVLARKELFDACSTLVHATHVSAAEIKSIAKLGAMVCVCPSTEADLGDGLVQATELFQAKIPMCLGSDDQTRTSILEEARLLEMHERLRLQKRNTLYREANDSVASHLLDMATVHGAKSLGMETGLLHGGKWADFVSYDLDDPVFAGTDSWTLLPALMFSGDSKAVRDVMVGGEFVIRDGVHPKAQEIMRDYNQLVSTMYPTKE